MTTLPRDFYLYNTLTKKKEKFEPLVPNHLGLYVCGPTVYGDPHLGHARPGITYDVLVRLFKKMGYKVRYVRNITDVGHLENDADSGEDKIARKARLEELEPMEVVQYYTIRYHQAMAKLNTLPPSIEPRASGHIIEQIAVIQKILEEGMAYEVNGSIYFDVEKYNKKYRYGILSGRILEDLQANTRTLDGQSDKRSPFDFALWKKASPEHIMRWPSPWSDGFPGWHLECSAMSAKYLGDVFDIHGGGMDLLFPHHECELAQNTVTRGKGSVRYWMHNNLITINGQKMGKSLGNFITLDELFNGTHRLLSQPFDAMTIRFFILQAHYRGTLDFSNEALVAAEKGLKRLFQAAKVLEKLPVAEGNAGAANAEGKVGASAGAANAEGKAGASAGAANAGATPSAAASTAASATTAAPAPASAELAQLQANIYEALCDDLNTPVALSHLFEIVHWINTAAEVAATKKQPISAADKALLDSIFKDVVEDILGLQDNALQDNAPLVDGLMQMILDMRATAKANKDWPTSDKIRNTLQALGVQVKDTKDGTQWSL